MPDRSLTRFLRQGLTRGMCPLCRVAHKLEREYVWYFFDEYSSQDWALDEVRRARGFCADHAEALRKVEVDGLKSTLGISNVYLDTLEGVAQELANLAPDQRLGRGTCPACAYRDDGVRKNARYLLDVVAESEPTRETFLGSPGLCFPHFELVWDLARLEERPLILEVQHRAVASLVDELREHVRKQGDEFKHEPKGAEADSWLRAIFLTVGWPTDEAETLTKVVSEN